MQHFFTESKSSSFALCYNEFLFFDVCPFHVQQEEKESTFSKSEASKPFDGAYQLIMRW